MSTWETQHPGDEGTWQETEPEDNVAYAHGYPPEGQGRSVRWGPTETVQDYNQGYYADSLSDYPTQGDPYAYPIPDGAYEWYDPSQVDGSQQMHTQMPPSRRSIGSMGTLGSYYDGYGSNAPAMEVDTQLDLPRGMGSDRAGSYPPPPPGGVSVLNFRDKRVRGAATKGRKMRMVAAIAGMFVVLVACIAIGVTVNNNKQHADTLAATAVTATGSGAAGSDSAASEGTSSGVTQLGSGAEVGSGSSSGDRSPNVAAQGATQAYSGTLSASASAEATAAANVSASANATASVNVTSSSALPSSSSSSSTTTSTTTTSTTTTSTTTTSTTTTTTTTTETTTTTTTTPWVEPTTTTTTTTPWAEPTTTTTTKNSGGGSGGGGSGQYSGDLTYYYPGSLSGVGSCGGSISDSSPIVAMNSGQMNSGQCGKTICIYYQGRSTTATIADTCPECAYGALDSTTAIWNALGISLSVGRVTSGMSWSFC